MLNDFVSFKGKDMVYVHVYIFVQMCIHVLVYR